MFTGDISGHFDYFSAELAMQSPKKRIADDSIIDH
jgi:hypothetical protein